MLRRLDVPFRDAQAADLAWSLQPGAVAPASLTRMTVPRRGPARVTLHVLGASHAVEVALAGEVLLTEVVAYGAPHGRALDEAPAELVRDGFRYRFASMVERHASAEMASVAAELQGALEGRADALLATFPGVPGAVTALRATPAADGAGWESWHLYPERGEVVRTSTLIAPVGTPSRPGRGPASLVEAAS